MLLKRTENLYFDGLKGVQSVLKEFDREGLISTIKASPYTK